MNVKEKFLKAIVLLMAAVTIFGTTSMMFSAAEIGDNVPTTTTKPTTTAAPTTAKPVESTTAKPVESTTADPNASTTAKPAETTTEKVTQKGDFEYTTLDAGQRPDRPTQAHTKAPTTAKPNAGKPATPAKPSSGKPSSNKKPVSNNGAPVITTVIDETLTGLDETTTSWFDMDEESTVPGFSFIDEDMDVDDEKDKDKDDKKDKDGIDFKKIIIIVVIVLAVAGAAVCLIILGKKQ